MPARWLRNAPQRPRPWALRGAVIGALLGTMALDSACASLELRPPAARSAEQFTGGRALVDLELVASMSAAAEGEPASVDAQWKAGMAHLRASLQGHVDHRDAAERYLERALALDPDSQRVPVARVLARFLNMRSAVLDLHKVALQLDLYASLLDAPPRGSRPPHDAFHLHSFHAAAAALHTYAEGRPLRALTQVQTLEQRMFEHIQAHPEDIDTRTMAANFELTFAGVLPVGADTRLRWGMEELAVQQDHWEALSPGARSIATAPNVRSVFAFQLAEALLAAGEGARAARRYRALIDLEDQPQTAPRAQLVALASERLDHLDAALADPQSTRALLPPWPAGVTGCVACHSRTASLPTDDLYRAELLP